MREKIQYYYDLLAEKIIYRKEYIEFLANNDYYYLMLENGNFQRAILIDRIMKKYKIDIYDFVINKNFNYITTINNQNYVLLKLLVTKTEKEIDFSDIVLFMSLKINLASNLEWDKKWIQKAEALEKNRIELLTKNKILDNTLDYYFECIENSVLYLKYYNSIDITKCQLYLQHKRLTPKIRKYVIFYNPFYIIFDSRVRDVSELIKQLLLEGEDYKNVLISIIQEKQINYGETILMLSRIMFPTYYFDYIEKNNIDGKKIMAFSGHYLRTIDEILQIINKFIQIPIPYYH